MKDKHKKDIVKGVIAQYFNAVDNVARIELDIIEERTRLESVKAIRYDKENTASGTGITRDEKIIAMIERVEKLEKRKNAYEKLANDIKTKHGMYALSDHENTVLRIMYDEGTIKRAARRLNYSESQVFRITDRIYRKLAQYV